MLGFADCYPADSQFMPVCLPSCPPALLPSCPIPRSNPGTSLMQSSRCHARCCCAREGSSDARLEPIFGRTWRITGVAVNAIVVCVAALMTVGGPGELNAQHALPPEADMVDVIDHYTREHFAKNNIPAVGPADDLQLLRRTTLDLAGRIPTAVERNWFMNLPTADRRRLLVDRLIHSPDFAFHHRNWLDETLLPNKHYDDDFRAYLLTAVQNRRSWDSIFREIMKASTADGPEKGASQFVKSRVSELDDLTNDTAILFFGVNISCAKCHDHPLVPAWKQDHFYGMQAFFQRTYSTRKTNTLAERPFGEVKFATVSGEEKSAPFMFLTGEVVTDRSPQLADDERKQLEERIRKLENDDIEAEVFVPEFRPREQLADVALRDSRDQFFARNIVNRVWSRLLGTGLVDPPDQMHRENPSSHPELLDWLTGDLVAHGYDLQRLIQGIVLSEVYGRSSGWTSESEPPPAHAFALAQTRALTPRQLAASLHVVVRNPEQWPGIDHAEEWAKRRAELEDLANAWVREFEQPAEGFRIAVDEALFFSNSERVQNELLQEADDRLLGQLSKMEDQQKGIEHLWMTVLNRPPQPEETASAVAWLDRSPEARIESRRQLLWALLSGPEFRFNH